MSCSSNWLDVDARCFQRHRVNAWMSANIQEILRCFICFGRVNQPHLCPRCSKMCCRSCIEKWLAVKGNCPYCRGPLNLEQLVNCRFMDDVYSALESLQESKKPAEELCSLHRSNLQYYCITSVCAEFLHRKRACSCSMAICSDCAMFGPSHRGHSFERLSEVYAREVTQPLLRSPRLPQRCSNGCIIIIIVVICAGGTSGG